MYAGVSGVTDGPPSTRFCRWRDESIGKQKKTRLHEAVTNHLHLDLYSARKEKANPAEADRLIADAFAQIKALIRKKDPDGIWSTHNADYGFARNLMASSVFGGILSLIGAAVCAAVWKQTGNQLALAGIAIEVALVIGFVVNRWFLIPSVARQRADRYAESMWDTFLVITEQDGTSNEKK